MKYKYVIWDFNGTVIDDTAVSMNAINKVLAKRNLPTLSTVDDLRRLFCFPVEDYYRRLGMDFAHEPYEIPANEWVHDYTENMFSAPLSDGIWDALLKIQNCGAKQIILSASELVMLTKQTDALGITQMFDEILGCDNVYAVSKAHIAEEWIKSKEKDEIFPAIMVGDTDHDFAVSKIIGCECVLYSGGFMSRDVLEGFSVPVFDTISEIATYICRD